MNAFLDGCASPSIGQYSTRPASTHGISVLSLMTSGPLGSATVEKLSRTVNGFVAVFSDVVIRIGAEEVLRLVKAPHCKTGNSNAVANKRMMLIVGVLQFTYNRGCDALSWINPRML